MNIADPVSRRHLSIGLLSSSLLAFQIILMQLLATCQWHHFAYLVISTALLGFGAAGSVLTIKRTWLITHRSILLPILFCLCGLTMIAPMSVAQTLFGNFDTLLLFVHFSEALKLLGVAALLMVPFFLGALGIGIIFTTETTKIGSYYFANLAGSGIGAILGLIGLNYFSPTNLLPACAALTLLAAIILKKPGSAWINSGMLIIALFVLLVIFNPPGPQMSNYKDLQRVLKLPDASLVKYRPSASGQIHIVNAPSLRSAPGLSLKWRGVLPNSPFVFINGNTLGPLPLEPGENNPWDATTNALPAVLSKGESVLILDAGSGETLPIALDWGAHHVVAVEPHLDLVETLSEIPNSYFRRLLSDPRVLWETTTARNWLARDSSRYDLIIVPTVGSFGGDSGLFALHEQSLLTRQGISEAWRHLNHDGIMAVTTWIDYPARKPLRLLSTLLAAMTDQRIIDPAAHLVAIRSWGTITFCVKRSELSVQDLAKVRAFCRKWSFDPLIMPDLTIAERDHFNPLQDKTLFALIDHLLYDEKEILYKSYPFRIRPATDDNPFFGQSLRWFHLNQLIDHYGRQNLPFLEIGLLVAALAAIILTGLASLLIMLPLCNLPGKERKRFSTLFYFAALGAGYMWIEIGMIHQFTFLLGQPVLAGALVISVLLIGSGLGSLLSGRFNVLNYWKWAGCITFILMAYALSLEPFISYSLPFPLGVRLLFCILFLLPLAVTMGFPFPLGLRCLDISRPSEVPWAWGINGCLSVVGAAIATLLVVEIGFSPLVYCASAAYFFAAMSKLA